MFATGVTMGLTVWIIDDTCLVIYIYMQERIGIIRFESNNDPGQSTSQSTSLKNGLTLWSVCIVTTDGHHPQK